MPVVGDATEEVVNGEVRIMPPPKMEHTLIVHNIRKALERQLHPGTFDVLDTQFGLIIRRSPLTSRVPDIAVFRKDSMVVIDGYVHSAPELIVEVLSPANRFDERAEKRLDYAALGVPEFWVVSPKDRAIEVFRLAGGRYQLGAALKEGALHPACSPEVAIDVASLWPR